MRVLLILVLALLAVNAAPRTQQKIVGGENTTINTYPSVVSLMFSSGGTANFNNACAGVIINNRSVMTAAHCIYGDAPVQWRFRAGSTNSNSGGVIYNVVTIAIHNNFNLRTMDNDICIVRANYIIYTALIQPAAVAGYAIGENQPVYATGWGVTETGAESTTLRRVLIFILNQDKCVESYKAVGMTVTANMMCAGALEGGSYDQCQGDGGGPLFHLTNNAVVGLSSFGLGCGNANFPGVNTRAHPYISWLQSNA